MKHKSILRGVSFVLALTALAFSSCSERQKSADQNSSDPSTSLSESPVGDTDKASATPAPTIATFGGGCFWCTEAVMEKLDGVINAKSGYMGGHVENPTYEQICEKNTGHVEVIQVTYDPERITFDDLLDVFWQAHDPTSWDQQGEDRGPQYRSVVFTHSPAQKLQVENSKRKLEESGKVSKPVVTEVRDAGKFWIAEDSHQDFYKNNPNYGYCRAVISPKLKKLGFE